MNHPQLDKARAWTRLAVANQTSEVSRAASEVIRSLPDEWIDAEELRELVVKYEAFAEDAEPEGEKGRIRAALYRNFVGVLEALLPAPTLPTLADMTPEERGRCRWMQCDVETDHGDTIGVIRVVWASRVDVIFQSGAGLDVEHRRVTPRPDLPRLEWPAQAPRNPEAPPAGMVNNASSDAPRNSEEIVKVIRHEKELCLSNEDFSRAMLWRNVERAAGQGEWKGLLNSIRELKLPKDSDTPRNPRPEDVPAGEPWILERYGHKWVGVRNETNIGDSSAVWSLVNMEDTRTRWAHDYEISLVSRLVPEHKENA